MDNMQPLWASRSLHTPFRLLDPSLFLASMQLLVVETRLCASATVYSLYVNTFYKNVTVCSFEAVTFSFSCMITASVRTESLCGMMHRSRQGPLVMERSWPCTLCVCFSASHSMAALPYAPFDSDFELSMLIIMHVPIISACTDDAIWFPFAYKKNSYLLHWLHHFFPKIIFFF